MEEKNTSIFSADFDKPLIRRRELLPWWMQMFTWIFFLTAVLMPVIFVVGMIQHYMILSLYGIMMPYPVSAPGFVVTALYLFKGVVSYGLWFEKDWGIQVAQTDAIIGIIVCISSVVLSMYSTVGFTFYFWPQLIMIIIYLIKLIKIKDQWV